MNAYIKYFWLCILLLCLAGECSSQRRFPEAGSPRRRNQIHVPLPDQNQLFISFNYWHELDEHSNIDSLMHLFKQDWDIYKASSLSSASIYSKILYTVEKDGCRIITPVNEKKSFSVTGDSLIPYGPDTLIIEKQIKSANTLSLPENLKLYFIFNNFDEYTTFDNLNNSIQQAKAIAAKHPKKDVFNPRYLSFVTLDSTSTYPVTARAYSSMPRKIIKLGVGSGLTQNKLYSAFSAEFTLLPELKRVGYRISWDEYFHFQGLTNDIPVFTRSSFANIGLVFFNPWPGTFVNNNAPPEKSGLMLGYLVNSNSNFFPTHTWRLAARVNLSRHIYIEPEIYWNTFFKNVFPGLRLNVAFFTNQ